MEGTRGCRDGFAVRGLHLSDLRAILRIERQSFGTPWSMRDFAFELSKPRSICLAAVDPAGLAGYVVCARQDALWNLRNLAVRPDCRRRGIASALMSAALGQCGLRGESWFLETRPSDSGAVAFYARLGFWAAGRLPAFYRDNDEDALLMWRSGSLPSLPASREEPPDRPAPPDGRCRGGAKR